MIEVPKQVNAPGLQVPPDSPTPKNPTGVKKPAAPAKAAPAKKAVPNPEAKLTPAQQKYLKNLRASMKWVAEKYGLAYSLINENPDIKALFQTAIKEKWAEDTTGTAQAKFMSRLRETKWWKTQSDEWRKLAVLKANDPTTYKLRMAEAQQKLSNIAAAEGATIGPKYRDEIIKQAISAGWDDTRIEQAMAGQIARTQDGSLYGKAGQLETELMKLGQRNGLTFSKDFYVNAARSVLGGTKTADDWGKWIREQAANQYQAYGDQIRAGVDLKDAASNITTAVAQELDLDPEQVGLQDKIVQRALTNVDEKGNPSVLPLWQVKDMIRQDDRFLKTKNSQAELANIGTDILKKWGVWK